MDLTRADFAILRREADLDDLVLLVVNGRSPTDAGVSDGGHVACWCSQSMTNWLASNRFRVGLPLAISSCGSPHLHSIVMLAACQGLGIHRAGIEQMLTGQQMLLLQFARESHPPSLRRRSSRESWPRA